MNGMRSFYIFAIITSTFLLPGLPIKAVAGQPSVQQQEPVDTLQERLYLHTDKNFYLAGELLWFKIYCVKATDLKPANLSKVAYVELIDRSGKPVVQGKISLGIKGGDGSFYLPLSVATDNYRIRAYTRYMSNDGPDIFFEKAVSIVNTIQRGGLAEKDSIKIEASFFPESGQMVKNIETTVAFHITDQWGKGVAAAGIVVNSKGDTITNFTSQHFGMGSFILKPAAGDQYKAIIQTRDVHTITKPLPATEEKGYVLNVTDNNNGSWKVRIQGKGADAAARGENVYLVASTRKITKKALSGFLPYDGELILTVDKTAVGEGVSQLTLFDKDHHAVSERLVFRQPAGSSKVTLQSNKPSYTNRQEVQLSAILEQSAKNNDASSYSLSVFQQDQSSPVDDADMASYLWLSSDLHGDVESPGFYFSGDPAVPAAIDELLLTHGWRSFETRDRAKEMNIRTDPEFRTHVVSAKITNTSDGLPGVGVTCFLSLPSKPFGLQVTRSDSAGMAYFAVDNYYGPGEVILQTEKVNNNTYRSEILTPFWGRFKPGNWSSLTVRKEQEEMLTRRSIAMQTQNIYDADSILHFDLPVLRDTLPFFGKPEYTYLLDDYKRFTTMEEVLREYVFSVNVVLHNGKLNMRMYDEVNKILFTNNLLVMIDGVPLLDYNQLFNYDPLKVKKLEVVPRRYILGTSTFSGIVSAETYQEQFTAFELDPSIIAVDYEGLQLHRRFYAPEYKGSQAKTHLPDLRTTLYWTPDLSMDKAGKVNAHFYSSDQKGKFVAVLQGIDGEGKMVSGVGEFVVE